MRFRLVAASLLVLSGLLAPGQAQLALVPMPREVKVASTLPLTAGIRVTCATPCDAEDAFAVAEFKQTMAERHIAVSDAANAPHVLVTRDTTDLGKSIYRETSPAAEANAMPAAMQAEGYAIQPDHDGVALTADTAAGVFYALQTVKQLIAGDGSAAVLTIATVRDWPAMRYRGLHDDLSRGPVDTLEFQKKMIRTLAAYKANLYSPYFESTQQYASLPLAGVPGASLTAADARELVAYAKPYHVVVTPEQEAFGHLRHMLLWEQYAGAAETPHGAVLAPGQPESLQMIDGMFKDLAALYPGPFLHIGGDETFELGEGRTRPAVDQRGLSPVYLDFLEKIVGDLRPLNRKILFWGDVAQNAPALLKAAPQWFKEDSIVVAWGYSPKSSFASYLKPFADSGFTFWVAPSINNYRQIWPNQQKALEDIQGFTRDGQKFGSQGQLNTLWDDDGESLANANWYGILFGAACAWQPGESSIAQFEQSYGQVFHGDGTGDLNAAQQALTAAMETLRQGKVIGDTEGSDGLFWVDPWSKDGQEFAKAMRPIAAPLRLQAEKALTLIAQARAANPALRENDALNAMDFGARRLDFLGLIYQLSDEMTNGFAQIQATAASDHWKKAKPGVSAMFSDINGVNGRLQDLTYGYSQLRDMYEQQWLSSYRPANLRPVLERYDYTVQLWLGRIDKVRVLQREWSDDHALDAADVTKLGIPAPLQPVAASPADVAPKP
jgi:hexosaminidase